jgi:hypothetical protein
MWMDVAPYVLAFVLVLVAAALLTPRRWWRRPTAANLALVGGGTVSLGWLLATLFMPAMAAKPAPAPTPAVLATSQYRPAAGLSLRVHHPLNLRTTPGVAGARLAVIPAGTLVTATGAAQGDWWQVSARVDGRSVRGWSSSLWLRQPGERGR